MAENGFKEGVKYTPKRTKPSKDKAKQHCRHLTDEEIERIKRICIKDKDGNLNSYYSNELEKCLKSIILAGIINIEGYDAKDLVSSQAGELVETKIESWFVLNERYLNIRIRSSDNGLVYSALNDIDIALSNILVPGYEEQQVVKEDSQK